MSDEEGFLGGVDGLGREVGVPVDVKNTSDLSDEAIGEAEVPVRGAHDRGEGGGVSEP
ncbi:hypothetical protein [Microbacterium sp. 69-7]|uniref:hypothetical protein n=1 Tax=Microbacterium sp. 69-7 TaxID=1895784 RepID=UPI0025882112|nr:hypothetical protein [Microbacterium sp. 69-7]